MSLVQDWINKLESGPWIRRLKITLTVLALVSLVGGYNWRSYRNMNSLEAMDGAQVARNISEGKGFTTLFIRPLSIRLVKEHNQSRSAAALEGDNDPARIKETQHPDLANAPVYPCVLAGWMKVYPLIFKLPYCNDKLDNRLWSKNGRFWWHPHDFMIAVFNEVLLFLLVWQTFLLARRLFDTSVAWLSAIALLGCELLWRFSVSGLSTMLLLLIFTFLVRCMMHFESEAREEKIGPSRLLLLAAIAGLLVGLGALTRYSFGWMLLPVLVFLGIFGGGRRWIMQCTAAVVVFLVVLSPWIYRNFSVSGTPFGTAGYAIIQGEYSYFSERSLESKPGADYVKPTIRKLIVNSREILLNDLPKLAGGWTTPFFLVGLLLRLRSPAIRRMRYFIVTSLVTLIVVQALGRTQISRESPDINNENLLVLLLPLILIYGVSLFFILLDQIDLPFSKARYVVMGAFAVVVCLPMIYAFLPPRSVPTAYPPYAPKPIYESSGWMRENELIMSDVPWAVAWYGKRQCVWLTLDAGDAFYAVNDYLKPARALYLTQSTTDGNLLTEMLGAGENSWGIFYLRLALGGKPPLTFPLRASSPPGVFPTGQLFLTDGKRWDATSETSDRAVDK